MIVFDVNNGGILELSQTERDGAVIVKGSMRGDYAINPGDMVMLLNYYNYIKSNNIKCDFINPCGKN